MSHCPISPSRPAREGRLLNLRDLKLSGAEMLESERTELRILEGLEPENREAQEMYPDAFAALRGTPERTMPDA